MNVLPAGSKSAMVPALSQDDSLPPTTESDGAAGITVKFLDAAVLEDRAAWLELWDEWPGREIMAHPDYARLFARPQDQVLAVCAKTPAGGILYPFIVRPLAQEPWMEPGVDVFDTTTPYGYGGAFAWGVTASESAAFWLTYDQWALKKKVVSSFARLSLFPDKMLPWHGKVEPHGPNIIRRLDVPEAQIWSEYSSKTRQNAQRGRRQGLKVEADLTGARLDEFLAVYLTTMKRCGASPSYYFPRSFFESICTDLRGHFAFFHMLLGTKVIASEIVLLSQDMAYSYLGGSLEEAFEVRGNEFLKHESFLWCRNAGKRAIVLGGGYRGADGILQFKRGFGAAGEVPFNLGISTYDTRLCDRLVARRADWERQQGREWQPKSDFFPPYRA
jgi:hypothetical protein